jgi:hypothetical protein
MHPVERHVLVLSPLLLEVLFPLCHAVLIFRAHNSPTAPNFPWKRLGCRRISVRNAPDCGVVEELFTVPCTVARSTLSCIVP